MSTALSRSPAPHVLVEPEGRISIVPPPPMAPTLLEQVRAAEGMIAECEGRVGALALAEAEGTRGATEALAELEAKITAARAECAKKTAGYKAALVADRTAADGHTAHIRSLPTEVLIAGITRDKCADLCHAGGCALACGINICVHPRRSGIPPQHQADAMIRNNHHAANREILRQEQDR